MKIVLVYPPNPMHYVSYNLKSKKYRPYGHQPPLGVGYVAAIAEKAGHDVIIIDGVAKGYSIEECADVIRTHTPDLIGISVMTHMKDDAAMLAEKLKKKAPGIPIVIGGTHAYYFHSEILKEIPCADFVLYGEIENSWPDFLIKFNAPEHWQEVAGLCYRGKDGSIKINDQPDIIENLDIIPLPSWHLYDFSLYSPLPFQTKGKSCFALITSRGCAYAKCAFCYQAGRKKQKYRRHSPARVVEEMKILNRKHGMTDIAFWDDTFSTDTKWLEEFAGLVRREGLHIHWTCSSKVSFVTKEKLQIMKEAGCWSIFFGVESGNQDLLDLIEKGVTLDQARQAVKWANEAGIETRCAYMLGLPGETPQKAEATINFAKELDSTYAIFYATHPRYGTKLYDIALKRGNFLSKDFKGMSGVTYYSEGYKSGAELKRMIRRAYTEFYIRPSQLMKFVSKIRSVSSLKEVLYAAELFFGLRG
jgi:Fe-S oxidoreductase